MCEGPASIQANTVLILGKCGNDKTKLYLSKTTE